jgi:hypothetical protein
MPYNALYFFPEHIMHFVRLALFAVVAGTFLVGCGGTLPCFTEEYRAKVGEPDLRSLALHVPMTVNFKSLRELDPTPEKNPFAMTGQRLLQIDPSTPGKVLAQGSGWVSVDFGRGIVLTFNRRAEDGIYTRTGWGTITIAGDRYDISVGVLSGSDIELHVGP